MSIVVCSRSRCRLRVYSHKAIYRNGSYFCGERCFKAHQEEINHPHLDSPPDETEISKVFRFMQKIHGLPEVSAASGTYGRWTDHPFND